MLQALLLLPAAPLALPALQLMAIVETLWLAPCAIKKRARNIYTNEFAYMFNLCFFLFGASHFRLKISFSSHYPIKTSLSATIKSFYNNHNTNFASISPKKLTAADAPKNPAHSAKTTVAQFLKLYYNCKAPRRQERNSILAER
jgi:hypothetical protein